jgi:hypothetical protein
VVDSATGATVLWRRGSERERCCRYLQFPVLSPVPAAAFVEEDSPKPSSDDFTITAVLYQLEKVTGADYHGPTEAIYRRVGEASL